MNGSVQCAWLRVALQSPNQKRTIDEWNSYLQKIAIFVNRPVGPYGDNWDLSPLDFIDKSSLFQLEGRRNVYNFEGPTKNNHICSVFWLWAQFRRANQPICPWALMPLLIWKSSVGPDIALQLRVIQIPARNKSRLIRFILKQIYERRSYIFEVLSQYFWSAMA